MDIEGQNGGRRALALPARSAQAEEKTLWSLRQSLSPCWQEDDWQPPRVGETRKHIGHWEIDTVHGKSTACVLTVVERRTGLVRIGALKRATKELTTRRTISLLSNEAHRVRTITADNGCEFHDYKRIEAGLKIDFYFATPHHAWERGSNENTNGLIRQYLPKGTDLAGLTQRQCNRLAAILNNRPRKRLGYKTPNEVYYSRRVVALQS